MAKEIKFNIKLNVDGKEQLGVVTADLKGVQDAFARSKKSAAQFRNTLITFNQSVEAIKNVGESVKQVGEAFSTAGEKMRSLQQSYIATAQATGLSGKELASARAQAQALASTFGGDLSEVLRVSNSLAKGFGVSMDEALKLMKDGFISGANVNGEFLDTVREYPRYFKEAGISAEEFIAITTNAAKQGIYSDKGVDTIKEGNLRIREMTTATAQALEGIGISANDVQAQLQAGTTTTFQVMQMVAAKLKELPASASVVGTAIADIFGGPGEDAGLEYIKSLADIELSMDKVCEGADEYSKSLGKQMDVQAALNVALSGVQEVLIGVNAKYGQLISITGSLLTITGNMATTLSGVSVAFSKLAGNAKVAAAAQSVWNGVSKMGRALNIALSGSAHAAAAGAIALKLAFRGLLIATGVGAAITVLTVAVEKLMGALTNNGLDDFNRSLSSSQSVAQQAATTYKDTLGRETTELQSKYKLLQEQWRDLQSEHEKTTWIKNCQSEFSALGLTVNNIKTAEDVFVNNTKNVEDAFNKRAEAAAHAAAVAELYKQKFELENRIHTRNDEATQRHASGGTSYKAGDIVSGNDKIFNVIKGVIGKEVERVGKNFRLTAYAAEKGNQYFTGKKYRSTSTAQRLDENALKETDKAIADHLHRAADLSKEASKGGRGGSNVVTGSNGSNVVNTSNERKEIQGAVSEEALKSNISYYEQMRSKVENNAQAYADWTKKILEAQDALSALQGIASHVKISRDFEAQAGSITDKLKGLGETAEETPEYLNTSVEGFDDFKEKLKETGEVAPSTGEALMESWGAIKGIGGSVQSLTDALSGNRDAWSTVTTVVDSFIQMYQGFSTVIGIIKSLTAAKKEETAQSIANTSAKSGEAISEATEQGAKLAFPYNLIAIAAGVAAVVAALASIGSFATGGIVGGTSTTGDKVLARVNSGEMILNRKQQGNLLKILSERTIAPTVQGIGLGRSTGQDVVLDMGRVRAGLAERSMSIEVVGKLSGTTINMQRRNVSRIQKVSGLRS